MLKRIAMGLLAMALLAGIFICYPAEVKADMTEVSIEQEISILGIDGKTYNPSDMEEDVVVLIFGNTSCFNTYSMIAKAEELLEKGTSIKIVLMDEEATDDGMESFAADHPNVLVAHDGSNYNWIAYQLMNQAGITFRTLPGTFLMDKDRVIRYASQGLDTDGLEEAISTLTDVPGATKKQLFTVQVTGTYGQTEARTMLQMINEFRTGDDAYYLDKDDTTTVTCSDLGELVYDYGLEKIAMQRAMEIALSFEHTRPNGNSCFTAYTEDYSGNGENIAAGYTSASSVFVGWREDDKLYAGQGHRRNMLNSEYKAIGIGHVYYNGVHYWVQEFSGTVADTNEVSANDSDTTVSVEVSNKKIVNMGISVSTGTVSVACGQEVSVPTATAWIRLTNSLGYCPIVSQPEWSGTSDYYTLKGSTITGKAVGTDTITVTAAGMSGTVTVNVVAASDSSGTESDSGSGSDTVDKENDAAGSESVADNESSETGSKSDTEGNKNNASGSENVADNGSSETGSESDTVDKGNDTAGSESVTDDGNDDKNSASTTDSKTILTSKNTTIKLSASSFTYIGKAKKPTVTVYGSDGKKISEDCYTINYSNNINVGKATVTITFKGDYTGTITATFKINPKATTLKKVTSAKTKTVKVTWKKQATQTTGYEIQYSTSKKFTKKTTKTATVKSAKTTSTTIKKLTVKKKYYFRIRTYKTVKGKKYYSAWSKVQAVKTK